MSYNVPEDEKQTFNKQTQKGLVVLAGDIGDTLARLKTIQPETLVEAYNKPVQAPVTRDLTPLEQYVYDPQPVEEVADLTAPVSKESMVTQQEEPKVLSNFVNQAQAQFGRDMVSITPYEQAVTDIVGAEVDSMRNDAGEIASSPLEVFAKPLDANKIKALGFVDGEGKPTERGKLFFHLKNSGVFNEDGTITEKGQAYLMPRNEIGKPENIKAFKTWYDDYLDEPMQSDSEIFGAVVGFGKNLLGGLYNAYQTKEKLTNPFGLLDVVRQTAAGKKTIAELKTDQIASLEQIAKNFQNIGGYADIIQGLTGRALYEGAATATGVPMQEMKDAAEENLYLARQRQWQANENLRDLEVGEIAEAITGLDGFVKMADEAKATLGEEQFNQRYAGASAVAEMVADPANLIPAGTAFKVAGSAPIASRAILKAQQTLGRVAQVEQALNKAQTIVEAGNTILKKEAVAVPLAQKLFTDISARAGSNPELLARAQQALDAGRRITAGADEVRAAMPNAIASVNELAAKRASLATRIPEEYAKKVLQTAELGAKIRSAPAKTVGAILERTGSTLTKVDNAVTGFFSERGLDQAYNAALGAAGVVGLAGNPIVGTIGAGAAALKAGKFITEYGKIFKYVGKEMERARSSIPFWKRVGYHTAPKSLGQGLSHAFNIFELGGATSDILRRVGRGIVAAYPSDLFFEYLSDGGDMRPQTMTRAAAESLVIGGSFAAGGGAFMGTNKRMREIAINDEINFRQGLVDTDQKARFEALPPVVRRSLATYSMANPTLNYNFIESGSSGYEPNTNTANININSTNPLKALVAHETLHHTIIKNNMEGGIAAMFLGDTKTNSAGGLFRSKSGKLDPEFEAFTNNYYDRLRAGGMTDAEIKIEYPLEKVAVEYFIEQHSDQYAAMAESGELGAIAARGELRKKLGSVLETILPKIPVLRDLHFKSGGAIDANGALVKGVGILGDDGLRQNPIANRMFREMNKRSSGMMPGQFEPLLSDKEGSGAPLFFDPANEIDMELLHPLIQMDANDKPILKDGRPIALSKEVDMNRAIAGLSVVEAYRNLKDNNYVPEKGEAYVDDDGEFQPGWISDRVLTQMFAKHQFNNEQKRMIRQTNKMVKEGNGQRMVMINFPATTRNKAGKVVYKTQGATIRDTVPVAVTISKDGNILYGLMSVTKLQENIKKRANERRGKKLYGGNVDLILRDVQAMMDFHKQGVDSLEYFSKKYGAVEADQRKKFINTMFGLLNKKEQAVLNPMLLEDGVKSRDNVYRTYRADRVSKAIPMSPDEYAAMPFSYEAVSAVRMPEQRQMPEGEAPAPSPTRFMPEKIDADYMKAVESGDIEAQQRIVDEAARIAGYDTKAYHGSPDFKGHSFDRKFLGRNTGLSRGGFSFARDEESARNYMVSGLDESQAIVDAANEVMSELQDRIRNGLKWNGPFGEDSPPEFRSNAVDDIEDLTSYMRNLAKTMPNDLSKKMIEASKISKTNANPQIIRAYLKNPSIVNVGGKELLQVKDPSQIKSADPITRDDSGNIIPPSKRFDINSKDLRFMPEKDVDSDKGISQPIGSLGELRKNVEIKSSDLPINTKSVPKFVARTNKDDPWKVMDGPLRISKGNYLTPLPNIKVEKTKDFSVQNQDIVGNALIASQATSNNPKEIKKQQVAAANVLDSLEKINSAVQDIENDPFKFVDTRGYAEIMKKSGVAGDVLIPPSSLRIMLNDPDYFAALLSGGYHGDKTVPGIRESAMSGLDAVVEMRDLIKGRPPELITALHHLWGTLSKQLPPLQQEALWMRMIVNKKVMDQIKASIDGTFNLTPDQWKNIVSSARTETVGTYGKLGENATSNANSFYLMLSKHNGRWNEVSDVYQNNDPVKMRYAFNTLGHGATGIKNKVQSFIGLTFGIKGNVLDRWRFVDMYLDDAMKLTGAKTPREYFKYEGKSKNVPVDKIGIYKNYGTLENNQSLFSLMLYSAMDRVSQIAIDSSPAMKQLLGNHADPGGLHWLSWNAIKNEAVGHSSLDITKNFIKKYASDGDFSKLTTDNFLKFVNTTEAFVEGTSGAGDEITRLTLKDGVFNYSKR